MLHDLGVGRGLRRFLCGIFLLWMHLVVIVAMVL